MGAREQMKRTAISILLLAMAGWNGFSMFSRFKINLNFKIFKFANLINNINMAADRKALSLRVRSGLTD
jgi:hypothetical protein